MAILTHHIKLTKLLLEAGARVTTWQLCQTAELGMADIALALLEAVADVDAGCDYWIGAW